MQHLDLQVIKRALQWANQRHVVWLCTVLSTFSSSPREPGAIMAACSKEQFIGSLSGGCVEENFLERLEQGALSPSAVQLIHYGGEGNDTIRLPCGGRLDVLVERLEPSADTLIHLEVMHATLMGRQPLIRHVMLDGSRKRFIVPEGPGPVVRRDEQAAYLRIGPSLRLVIAGISAIATPCAQFAQALGFEVIACDPREEMRRGFDVPGVEVQAVLPSQFIASGACHAATAIVALTHDPRIDDLAMIEAVRTDAFYIGVMGSKKTSAQRAERLRRSGGLSDIDIARIVMPIGLELGSKTPAEIALATMADILRIYRGK